MPDDSDSHRFANNSLGDHSRILPHPRSWR